MDIKEVVDFAMANPVAYMATVDGARPRVRAMNMWKVDNSGFYFHNNATKSLYDQLKKNQKVDMIFPESGNKGPLRVAGTVEWLDEATLAQYYKERPDYYRPDGFKDAMFRVKDVEAWFRSEKGKRGEELGQGITKYTF
jgi:uncharacterized pyridoxamine 5'-phosphate oxidase family protein